MCRASDYQNTHIWIALLLVLVLLPALVSGCSADCGWSTKATAFVDDNRNGIRDKEESALPGVTFFVMDTQGNSNYGRWESDVSGTVSIAFFVECNRNTAFTLSASPPEGFVLTTPQRVDAGSESGKTFTFGFDKAKQ